MTNIPDFSEEEQKRVNAVLYERYGKFVLPQLADSELQLIGDSMQLTLCPTLYWSERGAHFIVCKVAEKRYHCQFFYTEAEQFGTGIEEYNDIRICVLTLLQVQSDHERQLASISSGLTATNIIDDEYHSPLVV